MSQEINFVGGGSSDNDLWAALGNAMLSAPIFAHDLPKNLGLWHSFHYTARLLMFADLYREHIVKLPGDLIEFGVRWGQDLVWLAQLRALYEPWRVHRRIIGFDTFAGHVGSSEIDGDSEYAQDGAFTVSPGWPEYLMKLLRTHEEGMRMHAREDSPNRFDLYKGDVRDMVPLWLKQRPESMVALAILDLDLYEPTKFVLEAIQPRLYDGSVIVFDELGTGQYPGETVAMVEALGRVKVRSAGTGGMEVGYVVVGD